MWTNLAMNLLRNFVMGLGLNEKDVLQLSRF